MLKKHEQFSLPKTEEDVLRFWKQNAVFEKSLKARLKEKKKEFVFYEGPPTANGKPGLHHIFARAFKDIILRYKTMRGFYVPRKGGWDTHGLPVEIEVEKELGLKSKKEIEEYGIAEFNAKCKESVWKYKDEWERLTERIGFWIDMKHPYITYENSYMESIWWILKEAWKKKLLYKGHKVVPWCPRCGTALSSHELALGYKEITDASVYIKFKLKKGQKINNFTTDSKTYILSWTTTPWTLPGNVALAVGKDIQYRIIKHKESGEIYIIAIELIKKVLRLDDFEDIADVVGNDLVVKEYEPLFNVKRLCTDASYKIYSADFVTTTDGTGVVHTAVMYGEDDYNLGKEVGLPQFHTVDERGKFTDDVEGFTGMYVKSKETEEKILVYLKAKNYLLKIEPYTHEYPFCWRCSSALLYYARDSWFIAMSDLRKELIAANQNVKWIPEHIKDGRFGEWLREVKDWAISRSRYWGTPLPIWECDLCGEIHVCGGVEELSKTQKPSKNTYIIVRHGEAENNVRKIHSSWPEKKEHHLTLKGRAQVKRISLRIKKHNPDYIFSSDLTRGKETSAIIAEKLGISNVHFDSRLREISVGEFNGMDIDKYRSFFGSEIEKFTKPIPGGESLTDVRARVFSFIQEIEKKYSNAVIVVVTHGDTGWMFESALHGWTAEDSIRERESARGDFLKNADMHIASIRAIPRDKSGLYDLHKPFIDDIIFSCVACGNGTMKRVPEVLDVWFDSGAMPFAQEHFPFDEKGELVARIQSRGKRKIPKNFPADYITEGIDQTRGWFYTLLAISVLLGNKEAYRNVISLGLVVDKNGQKMSKSKGNTVSPWDMLQKYGADTVRWYFYTINSPGEPKKFDEMDLSKTLRQFIFLIYNSFIFFDTYADHNVPIYKKPISSNILDRWILGRLSEMIISVTKDFEVYEIGSAGRTIENFVGDLSRWYIRRSRRRLQKPDDIKDYRAASHTLGYALLEISRIIAPFTPFFSEALYQSLRGNGKGFSLSVHLTEWPCVDKKFINTKILSGMEVVRSVASDALAKRSELGIKVRQPLNMLRIKDTTLMGQKQLLEILKDEVNIKNISFDGAIGEAIILDTNITYELKNEGIVREFVRMVQGLRQDAKLKAKEEINLFIKVTSDIQKVLSLYDLLIKKEVNAKNIFHKKETKILVELETRIDGGDIWVGLKKNS